MTIGQDQPSPPPDKRPLLSAPRLVAAVCLIAPFVAMLWIPSYNKVDPKWLGFPFFYWYQLLWVVITAVLMAIAFQVVKRDEAARRSSRTAAHDGSDGGSEAGR
ncbi:MAG: DUF3311 domain-containing protein [Actinocrinis sp.]